MRRRRAPALPILTALLLAGCTAQPAAPAATPVATTPTAAERTCESVIDEASIAKYGSMGYEQSEDFADRMAEEGNPLAAFVAQGGLLCQWGFPQSDATDVYALGPITDDEAAAQQVRLIGEGAVASDADGGRLYYRSGEYVEEYYLFLSGYWYYASHPDRIDELRARTDGEQ
jgi:hypothetical protein